ncbi:YdcF family protein [Pararobbsia alpina]|uniref:DUF218 domain-containing protein n=1 Tax=Pararobbsia alpina TaxID=621374 RepID=A0A6S7AVI5_9BURK|nr:YdcF family protein [Pararobbsia alpina]CAB3779104.1 hypothetical protein LMG28138_00791 [Pararobbsia alpina]
MMWVEGVFVAMLATWGAAFQWLPGRRRITVAIGALALWAIGSGWIAHMLLDSLRVPPVEPQPPFAAQVAIVVLGGGTVFDDDQGYYVPRRDSYMKGVAAAALYRDCRSASSSCTVFLSGGDPEHHGITEAEAFRRELVALNVPQADIRLEPRSWNTYQNAKYTTAMLGDVQGTQIFLITAPYHMHRALAMFERFHVHPIPWSSALAPPKQGDRLHAIRPLIENVRLTEVGVHEILGMVQLKLYAALGWY